MQHTRLRFAIAIVLVGLALWTNPAQRTLAVEIIGHRGSSHTAPENTLAAIQLSWQENADATEIDVWLTADHRIAVSHDDQLERTTGHDGRVSAMRLDELQQFDAGVWKGPAWKGQRIPTLEAVLATIPDGKRLFVEVKCGPEIVDELLRAIDASGKQPAQVVVISFHLAVVKAVKKQRPELAVYWLRGTSPRQDKKTGQWIDQPDEILETCRKEGLDGLNLAGDSRLTREYVDQIHRLGMKLYVWTIDSPEEARRLMELGVDGITTNRPGWMKRELKIED